MGVTARREREREERRCAIIEAADEVFARKGLSAATMDEIAAAAEVSKGTLYLYFKSKDELFLAGIIRSLTALYARYEDITAEEGTGYDVLRALGLEYIEFARTHRDHFRLGMSWMFTDTPIDRETPSFAEYTDLIQGMFRLTLQTIDRGIADGSVRAGIDGPRTALQLWGGTVGILLLAMNSEELTHRVAMAFDFDTIVPSFIDLVLGGIKGDTTR